MAEAATVLGLIGSIVNITDAIVGFYNVAKETHRLPAAFEVVAERMSLVQRILSVIKSQYHDSDDESAILECFTACEEKAEDLRYIFEKISPKEGDPILTRYRKAILMLRPGRGDKVENLFRGILDTLQTLQAFHVFKNIIPVNDLKAAIEEVGEVEPSMPDGNGTTIHSSGTGAMFNTGVGEMRVRQANGNGNYLADTITFNASPDKSANPTLAQPFFDPMLSRRRVDSSLHVPRPNALRLLEHKLSSRGESSGNRHGVLVHGFGGTGKTQLVLEFVRLHRAEYSMILWIDATSPESFVWSCVRLCTVLQVLSIDHHDHNRQALIPQRSSAVDSLLTWLDQRPNDDKWILVLDNVDDLSWGIRDVIPKGSAGSLIATSQDDRAAKTLGCVKLSLECMEPSEAKHLLRVAAFPDLDGTSLELGDLCLEVCALVDYLPLAVHLAAATIQTHFELLILDDVGLNDACKAVRSYIDRFKENEDILLMRDDHKYVQSPYNRTLLTAFETTFEKLQGEHRPRWEPPAMKLLTLLAFLENEDAVDLHERFRQAYSAILRDDTLEWAARNLPKWLSKVLTGESSVAYNDRSQADWDCNGYCDTLVMLQRYGLVRPHAHGFPDILPLHKIVRWRVRKEGQGHMVEYLFEYSLLLELALLATTSDTSDLLGTVNKLADLYLWLRNYEYAEDLARIHLDIHVRTFGRRAGSTIRSLGRLIEILGERRRPDEAQLEIFYFVRDAHDRAAVLEALPAELLLLLNSVFTRDYENQGKRPPSWDRLTLGHEAKDNARADTFIGAGQALQMSTWLIEDAVANRPAKLGPVRDHALEDDVVMKLQQRKRALQAASDTAPDLITLFEVLSLGSGDLISTYMRFVDAETVRYRDPIGSRTVLHYIAAYGKAEDVQLCIDVGSEINAKDRYGATPLHIAGLRGRSEVFRALIYNKAEITARDNSGRTPLENAQRYLDFRNGIGDSSRNRSLRQLMSEYPATNPSPPHPIPPLPEPSIPSQSIQQQRSSLIATKPWHGSKYTYVESDDENSSNMHQASQEEGKSIKPYVTDIEDNNNLEEPLARRRGIQAVARDLHKLTMESMTARNSTSRRPSKAQDDSLFDVSDYMSDTSDTSESDTLQTIMVNPDPRSSRHTFIPIVTDGSELTQVQDHIRTLPGDSGLAHVLDYGGTTSDRAPRRSPRSKHGSPLERAPNVLRSSSSDCRDEGPSNPATSRDDYVQRRSAIETTRGSCGTSYDPFHSPDGPSRWRIPSTDEAVSPTSVTHMAEQASRTDKPETNDPLISRNASPRANCAVLDNAKSTIHSNKDKCRSKNKSKLKRDLVDQQTSMPVQLLRDVPPLEIRARSSAPVSRPSDETPPLSAARAEPAQGAKRTQTARDTASQPLHWDSTRPKRPHHRRSKPDARRADDEPLRPIFPRPPSRHEVPAANGGSERLKTARRRKRHRVDAPEQPRVWMRGKHGAETPGVLRSFWRFLTRQGKSSRKVASGVTLLEAWHARRNR